VTREEIVERMGWFKSADNVMSDIIVRIEKIVNAAIAAERKACVAMVENLDVQHPKYIADAIRKRGDA
jgi:hypothetical protein